MSVQLEDFASRVLAKSKGLRLKRTFEVFQLTCRSARGELLAKVGLKGPSI